MTYGHVAKDTRIRPGFEKRQVNDAYRAAGNLSAKPPGTVLKQKKVRRHNRQIYRASMLKGGRRRRNQAPHETYGFRLFGEVLYGTQTCFVTETWQSGHFTLKALDGTAVHRGAKASGLKLLKLAEDICRTRGSANSSPAYRLAALEVGASLARNG